MAINFDVGQFRAALTRGGLRPNQFSVQLNFPTFVTSLVPNAVRLSPLLVSIAELPGQVVNPAIVNYRGREVKFAGDRVYAPWTITALNDSDLVIRKALEVWMNGIDGLVNKEGFITPSEYMTDVIVKQLDRNGSELKTYLLRDAFPVDISPVALDWGANDQISTFTVTWQYQDFVTDLFAKDLEIPNSEGIVNGSIP